MKATAPERARIPSAVLIAKVLLMVRNPNIMNGMLIRISNNGRAMPVDSDTRSEIPTAPPSMKLLGSKKPFRPNPADSTPSVMKKISFNRCLKRIIQNKKRSLYFDKWIDLFLVPVS